MKNSDEFKELGITSRGMFGRFIDSILNAPGTRVRKLSGDRKAYWDEATGTAVIHNPQTPSGGTAFRTDRTYFDQLE